MASSDVRKALRVPFPADEVRQRVGPGGKKLDYIGGEQVLRRLLEVTADEEMGYAWTINGFTVEKLETPTFDEDGKQTGVSVRWAATVSGTLLIAGDAGGGIGAMVNAELDMAVKSANTEAIKNAAKNGFGVALELWDAEYREGLDAQRRLLGGSEQAMKQAVWKLAQQRDPNAKTGAAVAKLFGLKAGDLNEKETLKKILKDEGILA
jgi:hypothetical protein